MAHHSVQILQCKRGRFLQQVKVNQQLQEFGRICNLKSNKMCIKFERWITNTVMKHYHPTKSQKLCLHLKRERLKSLTCFIHHLSVSPSTNPSIYTSARSSVSQCVSSPFRLSISSTIRQSVCPSVRSPVHQPISSSVRLSVRPSFNQSVDLCVCLSVCLSAWLPSFFLEVNSAFTSKAWGGSHLVRVNQPRRKRTTHGQQAGRDTFVVDRILFRSKPI